LSTNTGFGRIRNLLWPIHRYELKKFLPFLMMFFLVSFGYSVLRTMKDTLVVTAQGASAEVIPFIKVWAMFPGAILMTFIYTWLSNRYSGARVFYTLMTMFLVYFLVFVLFLYPNHEILHNHGFANFLEMVLPAGCRGLVSMVRNWTFTLFYVMSELWSNIILTMLFWGFVNQVTRIDEAKRFYGLFGLGANLSAIISGQVSVYLSRKSYDPSLPFGNSSWEQSLILLLSLVLITGFASMCLYYWINKNVLSDPKFYCEKSKAQEKAMRGKLSLRDSFKHLFQSKYLIYIAVIVVGYNIVINLVEVLWKDQVRMLYPNPSAYNCYINQVSTWVGIIATISALLVSTNAIRRFGWTFTALLTPLILLLTSVAFFGVLLSKGYLDSSGTLLFGMTPLALAVFVGSFQNVLSRGAKYTVFDATKEIAFVPLSAECKVKGKAAIDGVFNRMGKSGGSIIHQTLLIFLTSFAVTAPYIAGILLMIIGGWMSAVRLLGKEFNELTHGESEATIGENVPTEIVKKSGADKPIDFGKPGLAQ
tara:strand:+ start:53311 stop:54912 length:1602 start_codon:yes stop_codon:yes gene_type:complete